MAGTDQNTATASLLNSLTNWLTPFEQSFVYGKDRAGEIALVREQNAWRNTTGSGPTNPSSAQPGTIFDMLFGSPVDRQGTAPVAASGTGPLVMQILIVALVALLGFWAFKKLT